VLTPKTGDTKIRWRAIRDINRTKWDCPTWGTGNSPSLKRMRTRTGKTVEGKESGNVGYEEEKGIGQKRKGKRAQSVKEIVTEKL